jgi:hypothetical protein
MMVPPFVGVWRLISMSRLDGRGAMRPYWPEAIGLLIYTIEGHVAAQVYDRGRPCVTVPWESVDAESARTAFTGLATYFGRYDVDPVAGTVTHTIEGAMVPDWVGSKVVRLYRFIDLNCLELRVVPDAQLVADGMMLLWHRD